MGNTLRPEHVSRFFLLILSVMSGLLNLPQATCKTCNTKTVIPEIKISSSPPNHTLAIGAALNMTCIAWPRYDDKLFPRRWIKYIRWYDPQGRPTGAKCLQGTPSVLKLHCTLMLRTITSEQFGNYTCEAENDYSGYCRQKTVEIVLQAFLKPETVTDPRNQTVVAGFDVTFNCTAKGHPMPSITWIKNNASLTVQSDLRMKVIVITPDDKHIHSQLVITGVQREDGGKYHCLANNRAGKGASAPAFLTIKDLDDQPIIIVEDPRNRSTVVGSDVTLDCITIGYPRLKIKWLRNDNSNAVESNSRASIVQVSINNQSIHHQLVITAVRKEDDGKYQCVAENSAGANTSKEAFINVRDQDLHLEYKSCAEVKKAKLSTFQMIAIAVGVSALIIVIGAILWYGHHLKAGERIVDRPPRQVGESFTNVIHIANEAYGHHM